MNSMPAQAYWWKKYRIVTDRFDGYEVQVKYFWWPFNWWQCHNAPFVTNTHRTLDEAYQFISERQQHGRPIQSQ